ncbi:mediator of DNA damage checkpoint protein 1 isoform X2 [Octodon degus]|uniref:Mediator of DNA damage checkpoint protein 1 n=1 Tax=Octodon degus TaxID=10160 RepID=A0A6P6EZW6_OCTDE|nr:mediator of DNA damage checkpoint protein 1 isoform X2 [Octodon degus]
MEDTQTIDWDIEQEEEIERSSESSGCGTDPVGRLRVFSGTYGPEKDFPLYLGKNVVGRMPDCSVALPFPSISKQHAVIEISARDRAPILQDCGSLNGTQILRPPKVLSPGMSHRLRNHELILFADLPCQYRYLDVPLPVVSRAPLTVEETPRVPGDTHATRLPLAEDSEEESDFLHERCVGKESRAITSSPLTTVVPESDDEGPGGSGPSLAFNMDSDTDGGEAGEAPPAVRSSAITEAEQSGGDGVLQDTLLVEALPAGDRDGDTDVRKNAGNKLALERSHLIGQDSDTDVEEKGIAETPAAVLGREGLPFPTGGAEDPSTLGVARLQESLAGSDMDVAEQKSPAAGIQTPMVINSDTDDEEEVSAALTLARLKEGGAALWDRDPDGGAARALPVALGRSTPASGRDSDTDLDTDTEAGELPGEKRETLPSVCTEKTEHLVTAQSGKRHPCGDSEAGKEAGRCSHGTHPERSRASLATVNVKTEAEEEVPPGPAATHLESQQVPVEETNQACPDKVDIKENTASAVAAVRQRQLVATGGAQKRAPEMGAPGRVSAAQGERVVHTGTPGGPTPPQRRRAQTHAGRRKKSYLARTRGSKDSSDGCDDLDLQATQCFVESESLEAVPDVEDEPTQVFPCELPSEPGPPHQSPQAPGALDEPWEVLATQPFCVAKSERPEPLPTATLPEAFGSHLSPPRVMPPDQCPGSPAHTEPLETKGTGLQTVERDRGHADGRMPPAESASGDDLESPDAVPKALAPSPGPHTSQSRKQSAPQALLPRLLSSSPPVPRAGHTGAQDPPGPAQSSGLEPQPSARRWPSRRTPPTPLPSAAHAHCLPPASEPVAQPCLARTRRSSIKTPEVDEPAAPELQLSTSTDHHPVVPKTTPRATRGRTDRSSVKTSVPVVQMAPELQPSMSTHQPDSPEPTPRTTRSRANRSSVETPEVAVHVTPELQLSITIDQSIVPKTMPRAIGNRKDRSSVKTPGVAAHTALELQPSTSVQQPVTAKPVPRATRRQTSKSSSKTIEPIELSATDLEPPALMAQPVNLKTIAQGRLSSESQPPVTTDQTVTQEPDNQASYSRTQRAAGKRSSHSAPTAHQLCSEPQGLSSGDQIAGRTRAAASLRTVPDPCFPQPPEAPTCASRIPKVEAADSSGPTQQLQPAVSPQYKRPSPSTDSPPLLKRPQRGTSQKTVFPKKEKDTAERPGKAEDTWTPGPGKRKRTQMEEELQEVPRRGLRRNKPTLQSAAPKVLFTGVLDARGEQAVLALGGSLASSVAEASHLVTDRICRTVKFLCALGKGIPVLSLEWLQQSRKAGHFLPPDQFVVTDPEQEKNFGFSLRDALSRAQERRLLEGYEIHVTPGVRPPPLQMGEIISCCGGTVLPSMPRSYKPRRVVITCSQDLPRCSSASRAGLPLLSPEFLLTGVLKQEVRPEAFVISTQEQPSA